MDTAIAHTVELSGAFFALGLAAGLLTTLAGQGGGLLLLLACSAFVGPHAALAVTAPALLVGNVHRAALLRAHIDRDVALRMIVGAVPGSIAGGLLVGALPAWGLRVVLVAITALAVAKALGLVSFRVPHRALTPTAAVFGGITGASGGAGVLFAPVLLSTGLRGRAFVATSAAIALSTHIGRVASYAGLGLFSSRLVGPTLAVTLAITVGNALGDRVRSAAMRLAERRGGERAGGRLMTVLEYATLVVCVALSVTSLR